MCYVTVSEYPAAHGRAVPSVGHTQNSVVRLDMHSFILQWHYSPVLGPGLFFSFVFFYTQTVGLHGREISASQGRYLHMQDNTNTE
jgi:hypothetical protein